MDTTNSPLPPTRLFLAFQARDARAEIRFLCDVLGFVENLVVPGEGDTVAHAQLDWPGGGAVMLGTHRPDAEFQREPGSLGAYLVLDDSELDQVMARAQVEGSGARIVQPLRAPDYGGRELTLADPDGNLWSIGTYPGEPSAATS
jgi:uncharacterized glyoxalase superfamily protein PhnB